MPWEFAFVAAHAVTHGAAAWTFAASLAHLQGVCDRLPRRRRRPPSLRGAPLVGIARVVHVQLARVIVEAPGGRRAVALLLAAAPAHGLPQPRADGGDDVHTLVES
jgi:hypothetical protein